MESAFVIFGGTGDLSRRELYPALFNMHRRDKLNARVIACARSDMTHEEFVAKATEFLHKWKATPKMATFLEKLEYLKVDPESQESFLALRKKIGSPEAVVCDLAVPEAAFAKIIRGLEKAFPRQFRMEKLRLLVEKPFGHDLKSARRLNRLMQRVVGEQNIYRIDHFLAKEVVENLLIVRFANELFRAVWNRRHIECVQISFSEQLGMEGRGEFYEKTGALRDFVQSHIMQVLGLLAMEEPDCLEDKVIKDGKAAVLRRLQPLKRSDVVFGQYTSGMMGGKEVPGYTGEPNVSKRSKTETFVAMRAFVNTPRWRGVPFYIRTGKRMGHNSGVISIVFKSSSTCAFGKAMPESNVLQLVVNPEELFLLRFNLKTPQYRSNIKTFNMEYCYSCEHVNERRTPYEKIYDDSLRGVKTRFSRADEVEYAWRWLETLKAKPKLHKYAAGSRGPKAADLLIEKTGRSWVDYSENIRVDFIYGAESGPAGKA